MLQWLVSPKAWIASGALTALEIVLGIDDGKDYGPDLCGPLPKTDKKNKSRKSVSQLSQPQISVPRLYPKGRLL